MMNRLDEFRDNAKGIATNARYFADDAKDRAEDLINRIKLQEYIHDKKKDDETRNLILTILAVIGAVAAVAGIAYAVYRFVAPDYLEDYDDYDDEDDDMDVEAEK